MRFQRFFATALAGLLVSAAPNTLRADAYRAKPKLVVVLVLDQFRGDYLDRFRDDFKTANGFNLFLKRGAYFTDCYYDYANTMTAPGHSTIGTGAYTNGHGISLNEWWDLKRSTTHPVTSVEDERYAIVGDPTSQEPGASPRNELASTLGDEVVLATQGKSKLFGISMKDRAAILTSGHASKGAFWLDHASGKFITSTYWGPEFPAWAQAFNNSDRRDQAIREANAHPGHFYDDVGKTPASVSYLLDFAKSLIAGEQLGRHNVTDVLTISISSTDILGHGVGPDSPEQRAMIDAIDVDLNNFFTWLDKNVDGGMANVWASLTGDHGIAPVPAVAAKLGMPATTFNLKEMEDHLNSALNQRFSPGQHERVTSSAARCRTSRAGPALRLFRPKYPKPTLNTKSPRCYPKPSNRHCLQRPRVSARPGSPLAPSFDAFTPAHKWRPARYPRPKRASSSCTATLPTAEWYVMFASGIYEMPTTRGTVHVTPYSYDRHVPLAFYGSPFIPGTYHDRVAPVDIAATFASLLRVNQPSACVGHVLTVAIRPELNATPHPRAKASAQ